MSGSKRIRKNHYRKYLRTSRGAALRRFTGCLKLLAGLGIMILMSGALIFSHDLLTQCEYFRAKRIEITGNQRLSEEQVLQQADLRPEGNILSVNLFLARKMLLAHPWITEAEVGRELPNGIRIKIKEHAPLAILDVRRRFLINDDGEIFKAWEPSDPLDLPTISGLEFSDLNIPGTPRSTAFEAVIDLLQLGQKSENVRLHRLIKRIHVDREIGLSVSAFERVKVIRLGYNDYQRKYDRLKNLLFFLDKSSRFSNIDSIDLKDLNRIVVRPAMNVSPAGDHKEV